MAGIDPGGNAPRLGVGLIYTLAADRFARTPGALDYWTISPDMFWTDAGPGSGPTRFADLPHWVEALEWAAPRLPIVAHHIGLSIGSAMPVDAAYVDQITEWTRRWGYAWCSDHLSFAQVDGPAGSGSAGIALPVPFDDEVLDMVADRTRAVMARTARPFLLENPARYIAYPDEDMTEPVFINRLCARTGCGLLLDLHNLHCNAINLGIDPDAWLAEVDLGLVGEIHIAGGAWIGDTWADSHAGPCPDEVWRLLARTVPRTPNLRGITFEFHDSWFERLGDDGLADQVGRARDAWRTRA